MPVQLEASRFIGNQVAAADDLLKFGKAMLEVADRAGHKSGAAALLGKSFQSAVPGRLVCGGSLLVANPAQTIYLHSIFYAPGAASESATVSESISPLAEPAVRLTFGPRSVSSGFPPRQRQITTVSPPPPCAARSPTDFPSVLPRAKKTLLLTASSPRSSQTVFCHLGPRTTWSGTPRSSLC